MAISATVLTAVLGRPDGLIGSSARHGIDPSDIGFAREKRALGWGWQTIANIRRVNRTDLMAACGEVDAGTQALSARTKPPEKKRWRAPERAGIRLRVLTAIANGHDRASTCGREIDRSAPEAQDIVRDCKIDGLVEGDTRRTGGGWSLTGRGFVWLKDQGAYLA